MPVDARGTMLCVQAHIVERGAVRGPNRRAGRINNNIGKVRARGDIANVQRVILGPRFIRRPGEQRVIRRVTAWSEVKENAALCERITIQHDLCGTAGAR